VLEGGQFSWNIVSPYSLTAGSDAVRGQTMHFEAIAPSGSAVAWDFEGAPGIVEGTDTGHVFVEEGTFSVTVVMTHEGTTVSDESSVDISVIASQGDPDDGGVTRLAVGGTGEDDEIVFDTTVLPGEVEVLFNGTSLGTYSPNQRLLAFGQGGNDIIQAAGDVAVATWFYGDDGNDKIKGGSGNDGLFGGAGHDLLVGHHGRDLLVGGKGADRIVGNADDDVLVAGYTAFDYRYTEYHTQAGATLAVVLEQHHEEAIGKIMAEWTSSRLFESRVKNLVDGTGSPEERSNGEYFLVRGDEADSTTTVFDDEDEDKLTGSAGVDWFFFDEDSDHGTDLKDEAFADDLDWILGQPE
jgi:Ca2+-binding RTX toxin-like protein